MTRRRFVSLFAGLAALVLALPVRAQDTGQTRIRDVVYWHKMGVALTMDVFKPAKPNGIGVAFMVSGGWRSNHDSINPDYARFFTSRGMTVFEVVHGSQPKFTLPEILQDIHRAIRFIRTNAATWGVDPNRIGIAGGSAGGHLSLMMGAYGCDGPADAKDPVDRASSRVQAVACFYPPTDFLNYGKEGASAMEIPALKSYWHVFGITDTTPHEERDKIARSLSPIYGDLAKMPPTLIIHGDADLLVPIQQSQRFMARLEELKIPHELIVRHGKGHGWPEMGEDIPKLADWFEKYLK